MDKQKYYITTAIAYTSGKPHIGNTYEIVLADAIARYKRQEGYDVFFQTGTDEHGQKIELKAEEAGITPKEFVDNVSGEIKRIWDLMNTSYDKFIRTTDADHEKQVQKIFKKMYAKGDIYKGHYEGMYCTPCESFFTESQLVDGKCPDCGRPCVPAKEEAYFFKMSKYADRLIDYINTHPDFIQPESRKNEMMNNFLLPGLQDLCVSRTSFKWGIPVDFDPKHVVYVWLDALTNYITGIGYDCDGESYEQFNKLWPADLHLIGKDIIRFHTIYWPIFLMSLDLPLPKQVFGHPWLLQGDGKMSKSKGNVIKFVRIQQRMNTTNVRMYGDGFSPSAPITLLAISSPAPVSCSAAARESVPPKRKIVLRSMDLSASFSEITPVRIRSSAPIPPEIHNLMPILSSKIIASSVRIRMIRDNHCFHAGTLLKSFSVSNAPSSLTS